MDRRTFLKAALAVGAAAVVPVAVPEQMPDPAFAAGQQAMQDYLAGLGCPFELQVYSDYIRSDSAILYFSNDGGETWREFLDDEVYDGEDGFIRMDVSL